jgi:hypothetical protein
VDDAEVDDVVPAIGDVELLPDFPGVQRLHEIAEDSGKEGVATPPNVAIPPPVTVANRPTVEVAPPAAALPPAVPSVQGNRDTLPVAQGEANAAAAMGVNPMKMTLSQMGGKCKKSDDDPLLELYKLKMLESAAEREEERKRLRIEREEREADRLEERMLCKSEMELHRIEAESFKTMMMAFMMGNRKEG